jgi:3-deoxy-manno-octulosonate cytidylyltransferase (CMP-KDO synthetase)
MVELVYRNAKAMAGVDTVAVATCDDAIVELIEAAGGIAVMTSDTHERASDRTAEAVRHLEERRGANFDIVLMVQGDEPAISSHQMSQVVDAMREDPTIQVANLFGRIGSEREFNDPNCIKAVADLNGNAVYFSRLPIPHGADFDDRATGKQVCAIGFRRDYLMDYLEMDPTDLEVLESIDMLRILQHGGQVRLVATSEPTQSVDVPDDIPLAEALLRSR